MNKQEYMTQLEKAIENCSTRQKTEILADFEEHFEIGMAKGHSEEEIAASLGKIEDFIDDLIVKEESVRALSLKQADKIEKVIVLSDLADVQIVQAERIDCELKNWKKTDSSYYDFSKRIENDAVIYELRRRKGHMFMNFHTPEIEVQILEGFKLSVTTSVGDIEGEELVLDEIELNTNTGDIEIKVDANKASFHTLQGDVECKGKIKQLDISAAQGDIEIESEVLKTAKVVSKQGDIELDVDLAETVELKTAQGDIEGKINAAYLTAESKHGDIELEIHHTRKTELQTNMGDVEVMLGNMQDFEITASTKLGTIECELEDVNVKGHTYTKGNASAQLILKTSLGDIEIKES